MKQSKNSHDFGVVAQCHNPYREFAYCPLCNQYQEAGKAGYMRIAHFRELWQQLKDTNPMYHPDSKNLLLF